MKTSFVSTVQKSFNDFVNPPVENMDVSTTTTTEDSSTPAVEESASVLPPVENMDVSTTIYRRFIYSCSRRICFRLATR